MSGQISHSDGLWRFSAATLHEAAGHASALSHTFRPVWAGAELRGPAYTVRQAAGENGWIHRAIYEAPVGAVLVVATGDRGYGYWGELMTRAALSRGLAGLVIDGGVRDVDAIEGLAFPVFATAISVRGTGKAKNTEGSLGGSVTLPGRRVARGDIVVADRDGIAVFPPEMIDEVLQRAEIRESTEVEIRDALAGGRKLADLVLAERR